MSITQFQKYDPNFHRKQPKAATGKQPGLKGLAAFINFVDFLREAS